jgi:MATE family multidrug resistance protein
MLSLLSSTLMLFIDRLFLARWNPLALNAALTGGMAYYMFLVIPMGIVEISEVLVGRLHGEERHRETGTAAWQMIWTSLGLLPFFLLASATAPWLLFAGTMNEEFETSYFSTLMLFAFVQCMMLSVSGFFIGIGQVKIITLTALIGNLSNVGLDYLMIFGLGPIPAMGVVGAAAATGISQLIQLVLLLSLFWRKQIREKYGTGQPTLHRPFLFEGLRLGTFSGAGRCVEVLSHFLFFRIVMSVGADQMVLAAIAQSIYILFSFIIDAQSKGASAIVSNLLGAQQHAAIPKVFASSFMMQTLYFLALFAFVSFFPEQIYALFSAQGEAAIQMTPGLMKTFERALIAVSCFFLVDGFGWILSGFLTAAKDTRYVFLVSILVHSFAYVPPTLWFIGYKKGGADVAWMIIVSVTTLSCLLYLWRYLSGKWLKEVES